MPTVFYALQDHSTKSEHLGYEIIKQTMGKSLYM